MLVRWEHCGECFSGDPVSQFAFACVRGECCADDVGFVSEVVVWCAYSFACVGLVRDCHFDPSDSAITIWEFVLAHGFEGVARAPVEGGDPCVDRLPHVVG